MKYIEYEYSFISRFSDTDSYGIVHHSKYYCYFEEARYHLSTNALGFGTNEVDGSEYRFPVLESSCKHLKPLKYNHIPYIVNVKFGIIKNVKIEFLYVIKDKNNIEYAKGRTVHAFVKKDGSMCLDIAGWFGEKLKMVLEYE